MKAQPIVNDLNARQWKLVKFLEEQNEYLLREDIIEKSGLYDEPTRKNNEKQYVGAKRLLTHDLQKIKESERYDKILITDRKGIKIASNDNEVLDYFNREKAEILKRFKRFYKQTHQYRDRYQTRAVFGQEKPIVEVFNIEKMIEEIKED